MDGKFSRDRSLLTLLLEGLSRFQEPVFRVAELTACDESGTQALQAAKVLTKARRAETWTDPCGRIRDVRSINGMLIAKNPDNPGEDYRRIDVAELEQVRLVPQGFASWIAASNDMDSALEIEPGLWNLGAKNHGVPCRFYLMLSESAHVRVVEMASRPSEVKEATLVLIPSASWLTFKTLQQIPNRWANPINLANACRDGNIDLTKITPPSMPVFITNTYLSKQIEGIKQERIVEITEGQKLREELGQIAGDTSELMRQMVEGFGSDSSMANLFMLATGRNPMNKAEPVTFEQIGAQLGKISKQAVSAKMKKMKIEYPRAYTVLQSMREKIKEVKYSEVSPRMRRKMGIDKSYGYKEDLRSD